MTPNPDDLPGPYVTSRWDFSARRTTSKQNPNYDVDFEQMIAAETVVAFLAEVSEKRLI